MSHLTRTDESDIVEVDTSEERGLFVAKARQFILETVELPAWQAEESRRLIALVARNAREERFRHVEARQFADKVELPATLDHFKIALGARATLFALVAARAESIFRRVAAAIWALGTLTALDALLAVRTLHLLFWLVILAPLTLFARATRLAVIAMGAALAPLLQLPALCAEPFHAPSPPLFDNSSSGIARKSSNVIRSGIASNLSVRLNPKNVTPCPSRFSGNEANLFSMLF
jgi:hypothetical protein